MPHCLHDIGIAKINRRDSEPYAIRHPEIADDTARLERLYHCIRVWMMINDVVATHRGVLRRTENEIVARTFALDQINKQGGHPLGLVPEWHDARIQQNRNRAFED